jgi:hypothetical protein
VHGSTHGPGSVNLRVVNALNLFGRLLRVVVALAILVLFAIYIWPTRYRYDHVSTDGDTYPVRIDRFNGDADMLTPDDGWYPMGDTDSTGGSPDAHTTGAHPVHTRPTT